MKKTLILTASLLVATIAALAIALVTVDANRFKPEIVQAVENATGRDLEIAGRIELGVSLVPTLVLNQVTLSNAAWGTQPGMFRAGVIEAWVALLPLLLGELEIRRLELHSVELYLETDAAGLGNWRFGEDVDSEPQDPNTGSARGPALDEVEISDARLTYRDGPSGRVTTMQVASLDISSRGFGQPVGVELDAVVAGHPVEASGTLGGLRWLMRDADYPVDMTVNVDSAQLEIRGRVARPLQGRGIDLAVSLRTDTLADLSGIAGTELPDVGPLLVSGTLIDSDRGYALNGLEFQAGDSDLAGNLVLNLADRPRLEARLYAERFDLAPWLAPRRQAKAGRGKVFSADPLPLAALRALDGEISLDAKAVSTGNATLEDLNARLALDRGHLELDPFSARLADGRLDGTARLDAEDEDEAAELQVDLRAEGLQPGQLPDLRDTLSDATTDVTVEAKGRGSSVSEIMANLDGRLLMKTGPGTLKSTSAATASSDVFLETYRLLNPSATQEQTTRIECGVVHFAIRDGLAITDHGIALATTRMNVIGSGAIDLGSERIDLGFTTQAREGVGISAGQLADLVRLGGTLANPEPTLDTEAAVMTGVAAGAAVATSGLSIVAQGLYDRLTADDTPCETALAMRVRDTRSTGDKAADAVKGVGEAIKGAFDSLFGD